MLFLIKYESKFDCIWFVGQNFFLHLWLNKPLWVELKPNEGVIFITILLHFHHFISLEITKTQKGEVFRSEVRCLFRNSQCVSCYLLISSKLQFQF